MCVKKINIGTEDWLLTKIILGGVQQQKRQRTSCDFAGGMIFFVLFCSLFEDILLTKSGKNNKKEQKRSNKIKKDKNHDLFCSFLRTHFDQIGHKNVDFERVLKKNKKEQKRQRTSWVFPGGMIFFVVGPPPPPPPPPIL